MLNKAFKVGIAFALSSVMMVGTSVGAFALPQLAFDACGVFSCWIRDVDLHIMNKNQTNVLFVGGVNMLVKCWGLLVGIIYQGQLGKITKRRIQVKSIRSGVIRADNYFLLL